MVALALGGALLAACERAPTIDESYYRLQMETDLLNLMFVEDAYFTDNATYTSSLPALRYGPSYGVTITFGVANATGWNATASHFHSSSFCGVFVGTAPSPVAGAVKREPACP